jgi:hypothetical protein
MVRRSVRPGSEVPAMPLWDEADPHAPEREALADGLQRIERHSASLSLGSEAVSQR